MITETKTRKKMAFSYFGGKNSHLTFLLPKLKVVNALHFVDVFGGSGSVALNMDSEIITYNDINLEVVNFFKVLRDAPAELISQLKLTPYSSSEYKKAWNPQNASDIEKARCFFVRVMQSFGSTGCQKEYNSWSFSTRSTSLNISSHVSKWLNGIKNLEDIVLKLKTFQIDNSDFRKLISRYEVASTLLYCDPPYPLESRTGNIRYGFEMSISDHVELSKLLHNTPAMVAISGYECDLMNELYSDFYLSKDNLKRTNNPKIQRQECLWTSYNPNLIINPTLF